MIQQITAQSGTQCQSDLYGVSGISIQKAVVVQVKGPAPVAMGNFKVMDQYACTQIQIVGNIKYAFAIDAQNIGPHRHVDLHQPVGTPS